MADDSVSPFDADPSDGWNDLVQRFDPTQSPVSPAALGSASPDSPFAQVLFHVAMGGDPADLPPSYLHIVPQANMLLEAQPPVGPGLFGDLSQQPANAQTPAAPASVASADDAIDDGSEDGDEEDDDGEDDGGNAPESDGADGPVVPANSAAPVGPLDTNVAVPSFTPRPEIGRAMAANQRRAMALAQAQTDLKDPRVQALLAVVRDGESGGRYDAIVNSKQGFSDFSKHPNVSVLVSPAHPGADGKMRPALHSTAAGAYQMRKSTWDDAAASLGLTDFQPQSQDLAAAHILKETGAIDRLHEGDVPGAIHAAAGQWQIFPKADGNSIAAPGQTPARPKIERWLKAYNDKLGQSK